MHFLRGFWGRHKRKILVTSGVLGSGYLLYKLYDAHRRRLTYLDRELAQERENEELINARMRAHFENIQRIADTTTLPHALQQLSFRIEEELDLSHVTERLMKAKGQQNTLTPQEKLDLWEKLKILSFTKMVLSIWSMTALCLYIRVQVNILGRHMYIDTARGLGNTDLLDDADLIDREDQQKFLASADYLSNYGLRSLISSMHVAAAEVLKRKQLKDFFNTTLLGETTNEIIKIFMSIGSPIHWVDYLMPKDKNQSINTATPSANENNSFPDYTKFDHLMLETRAVLLSPEFGNVVEISLKTMVDAVMEDMEASLAGSTGHLSGMPLARLIPRVAQMGPLLLDEPRKTRLIQIIKDVPDVERFFTLLYTSMPGS